MTPPSGHSTLWRHMRAGSVVCSGVGIVASDYCSLKYIVLFGQNQHVSLLYCSYMRVMAHMNLITQYGLRLLVLGLGLSIYDVCVVKNNYYTLLLISITLNCFCILPYLH